MTTFESPLGKKTIASGRQMREFDIPDESEEKFQEFNVESAIRQPGMKKLNMDEINAFQARLNGTPDFQQSNNYEADIEREIKEAREMKKSGKEKLSVGAKKRLESLLGMTRHQREVAIGEILFVLQTLTGTQTRETIMNTSKYDGTVESPFEMRVQILARSITSIGGVDFDQFVGTADINTKMTFVESLDDFLLNRLYDDYLIMTKEAKRKYSVNTPQEAQEVINDIKK